MFLSKRSNGIYYIFYQSPSGKRKWKSTGCNLKSQATKYLSEFGKQLDEGKRNKTIPISLKDFFFDFLRYSETVHSWRHTLSLKSTFKQFEKFVGIIDLSDLTRERVIQFTEMRLGSVSNYAVKRDLANLSSAFNYAINKKYLNNNPCKGIKKPRIAERLPLFFTEIELQILLRVTEDKDLRDLINFAVNTGIRQSDLINLEWSQINFKNQTLILDNRKSQTKSRKVHTLPLNMKALQILTERQLSFPGGERVFTYQGKLIKQLFISHKFKKLVRKAGINPQLSFHSLRHSFASWLIQKGVPIFQVSKLLTHSDLRVTQIYAHLSEQNLKDAVELLN